MGKPPRAPTHRDYAATRAKSRPGVPVEIDPEETPPPREPPAAELFETLPPEAQIRALRNVVAEQSMAIERVWDARLFSRRLESLETTVAQDTRQVTGLIVEVQQLKGIAKDAFDKSLANSDEQIKQGTQLGIFFGKQFPEYLNEVKASNVLLRSVQQRVDFVETKQIEHGVAIANLDKVVDGLVLAERDKAVSATAVTKEHHRWLKVFKLGHALALAIGVGIVRFVYWLKS